MRDSYAGYDVVDRTKPGLVRAGCMAHARRKVFEGKDVDTDRALILLALIRQLYDVEAQIQATVCETKAQRVVMALELRQEKSRPVMDRLRESWSATVARGAPEGPGGEDRRRTWSQPVDSLSRFLEDGAILIDNNSVERQIRPIAVGRANWTFVGSEDAGPSGRSALRPPRAPTELQGVNQHAAWLKDVLERVRRHPPERM